MRIGSAASKKKLRPNVPPAIDYVTFRLDVLVSIAKEDASAVYERETGVSLHDLRVLRNVAFQPGLIQGQLVDLCYVEKTSLSKRVTALEQRGLLRRQTGEQDARQSHLTLTTTGEEIVARCELLGRALESDMLSTLSVIERELFDNCIDKITAQLLYQRNQTGTPQALRLRR